MIKKKCINSLCNKEFYQFDDDITNLCSSCYNKTLKLSKIKSNFINKNDKYPYNKPSGNNKNSNKRRYFQGLKNGN